MSLPPLEELVNTFEIEAAAKQKLDPGLFAQIEGSDRTPFEHITFRPRMMVNATKLDLTLDLFGMKMPAPIIAGPIALPRHFHQAGEAAIAKGATDAGALFVVAEQSQFPAGKADWWYQTQPLVHPARSEQAAAQGAKALCITLGDVGWDWSTIGPMGQRLKIPVVLKGVLSLQDARRAVEAGANGIVVSRYPPGVMTVSAPHPMDVLAGIVDEAGPRVPVMIDGSFRRGTDIMMALALGAKAILVARPVAWGLAAYGADGVRYVLEMLQTELGRTMAMCGCPTLASIDRSAVKARRW
jgi:isopentenyl diphosphate isomerase/L-lactate dehydrogenase-like FMN-dependent dehydrogenase